MKRAGLRSAIADERWEEQGVTVTSERRFQTLAAQAPVGIFLTDAEGRCVYVNDCWSRFAGLGEAEAQGTGWSRALHPEDRERVLTEWNAAAQEQRPFSSEYRFRTPAGQVTWIHGEAVRLYNEAGECTGFLGTVTDISRSKRVEAELRESEVRFRRMADAAPVLIWMSGADRQVIYVNQTWLDFVGRTAEQEEGSGWEQGVHPEDLERCLDTFAVAFETRREFVLDYRLRRSDGEFRWLLDRGVPRFSAAGEFLGFIGTCLDITERKQMESLMEHQNRVLQQIASGCPLGEALAALAAAIEAQVPGVLCTLLLVDETGQRLYAAATPSLPGVSIHTLEGTAIGLEGLHPCWLEPVLSSGGMVLGTLALHAQQPRTLSEVEAQSLGAAAHLAAIAIEAARSRDQLIHNALHDPLTGLPNRTLFLDRLDMALKRSTRRRIPPFAVLFIDLDRFKLVNDSLGHVLGDDLLKAIATRLKRCLRPTDTISRFGGDEFALLLENLEEEEQAVSIAARIQQDLTTPFSIGGHEVFSSASIGITFGSSSYSRPEEMLRDADTAMYRAKTQGRAGHVIFDPTMHLRAVSQLKIESALRRALEREEFRLLYQPIVSLARGQLTGFEALLRWQHPDLGLLAPGSFLAAAEDTGIIPQLGRWVLLEACRQTYAWQRSGPQAAGLSINVNLHPLQFLPRSLAELIEGVLAQTGLSPGSLSLEITEHVLLREMEAAIETLQELRALGLGVCIDDFGTGYSSLAYLLRFPVTTLKIDRSFVSSMRRHGEVAIVKSVTSLAHTLSLDVVAEGVETSFQLTALQRLGCERAQGFLFAEPLESAAAGALLTGELPWMSRHFAPKSSV